jgi:DnaK suppressor protein
MKLDLTNYRERLNQKSMEIVQSFRKRGAIAIEYSAEETEQMILKDERELAIAALERENQILKEIRAAQAKLTAGTYGTCEGCEEEISAKRLNAIPWARRCLACQEREDRAGEPVGFRRLPFAA